MRKDSRLNAIKYRPDQIWIRERRQVDRI